MFKGSSDAGQAKPHRAGWGRWTPAALIPAPSLGQPCTRRDAAALWPVLQAGSSTATPPFACSWVPRARGPRKQLPGSLPHSSAESFPREGPGVPALPSAPECCPLTPRTAGSKTHRNPHRRRQQPWPEDPCCSTRLRTPAQAGLWRSELQPPGCGKGGGRGL